MVFHKIASIISGDSNAKTLKSAQKLIPSINQFFDKYSQLKDKHGFVEAYESLKTRHQVEGQSLDALLPETFGLVKAACKFLSGTKFELSHGEVEWNMVPYDVQLVGGIVLHSGSIAEMKTGEGKTLVCTLPVILNALAGRPVYVVTVNEYLAKRDSEWMGCLYSFFDLDCANIFSGQEVEAKKQAYNSDVVYGTNNEFGFDYLRDNMAGAYENVVQKDLYYCIVDEVDSILID